MRVKNQPITRCQNRSISGLMKRTCVHQKIWNKFLTWDSANDNSFSMNEPPTCSKCVVPISDTQSFSVYRDPSVINPLSGHRHQRKLVRSVAGCHKDSGRIVVSVTNVTEDFGEDDFFSVVINDITFNLSIESDIYEKKVISCNSYFLKNRKVPNEDSPVYLETWNSKGKDRKGGGGDVLTVQGLQKRRQIPL